jgi:hypothetical protein
MVQTECLLCKHEILSSNLSSKKEEEKKREKRREEGEKQMV